MGLFSRKPKVAEMTAKKDIEGLIWALRRDDVRDEASNSIRALLNGAGGNHWTDLILSYGLFAEEWRIRESIAYCLAGVDAPDVREQVRLRLKEWTTPGPERPRMMKTKGQFRVLDSTQLARRIDEFRSWMHMGIEKRRAAEGQPVETVPEKPAAVVREVRITCTSCGKAYVLGKDAAVVSAMATMRGAKGVTVFGDASSLLNSRESPDLVDSLRGRDWNSLEADVREQQQSEIDRISSALKRGRPQWWRCRSCGTVQTYRT